MKIYMNMFGILVHNMSDCLQTTADLFKPAVVSSSNDQRFEICPANYHYPDRDYET